MSVFPKYERYKDSGFEWLGEVPEHWDVQSLRAVAGLYVEKNQPDLPVLSVYREYGVIPKDSRDDNHNATSLDTSNYKVVRPGDLAVNKMKAWQGSLGVSEHHGIVSPAYITCRLNQEKVTGRYIHYLLRSKSLIGALDSISYGVRVGQWDMRFEDFKKVGITIPPKPEQDRIVAFLDQKTAEIDALIAKKQRQIELLDEQKAILINRAVTRGLNPNAKLKPSGIGWIGEIPEHWEVLPLRRALSSSPKNGISPIPSGTHVVKTFSIAAVKDGTVTLEGNLREIQVPRRIAEPFELRRGDFLVIRGSGSRHLVGSAGVLSENPPLGCIYPDIIIRLSLRDTVKTSYLLYLINLVMRPEVEILAKTSAGIWKVSGESICALRLLLPPVSEQEAIVRSLELIEKNFEKTQRLVGSEIQSLKILRNTLIAHAVTGRIKS
jgi:type I restriction enzyme S subunit